MSRKMKIGADTLHKDKDGKAILIHSHLADANGTVYFVNQFCQALPVKEGVTVPLEELLAAGEVRVISAKEVLKVSAELTGKETKAPVEQKRGARNDAMLEDGPQDRKEPEARKIGAADPEIMAELAMVIQMIPDKMLADELRRRGYTLSAVKPVFIKL